MGVEESSDFECATDTAVDERIFYEKGSSQSHGIKKKAYKVGGKSGGGAAPNTILTFGNARKGGATRGCSKKRDDLKCHQKVLNARTLKKDKKEKYISSSHFDQKDHGIVER
ncbi:hypothetical protein L218DRAFT_941975 [Marasmius fiardii PR-910]|nr:hypothetical protein L218DRAFT_941975 [Marasmius fiardii PR-910]